MTTQLIRLGDKWALVIDQLFLEQLQIDENTPLELTIDGQTLIVTPQRDNESIRFRNALKKVNEKYGDVLKRLAD